MTKRWDRQADETDEWYDRFALYLYMGPRRTVAAAHAFATRFAKGAVHGQLGSWRRAARRFHWKQRAASFDAECGQAALANNSLVKTEQHMSLQPLAAEALQKTSQDISQGDWTTEERLRMVAELLRQVYGVLRHADLLTMSKEEARQLLPTLRLFFRDLLNFYQTEAAHLATEGASAGALSADDFMSFMKEMGGLQMAYADLSRAAASMTSTGASTTPSDVSWQPLRDLLAQFYPDESSARRIADQAHLDGARIHFSARAVDSWHAILTEAEHAGLLDGVIQVVQQEYGASTALANTVQRYRQARLQDNGQEELQTKQRHVRRKA